MRIKQINHNTGIQPFIWAVIQCHFAMQYTYMSYLHSGLIIIMNSYRIILNHKLRFAFSWHLFFFIFVAVVVLYIFFIVFLFFCAIKCYNHSMKHLNARLNHGISFVRVIENRFSNSDELFGRLYQIRRHRVI